MRLSFSSGGFFAVLLGLLPTLAYAGLYKCIDGQKRVFYQDRPCQALETVRLPRHLSQLAGGEEQRPFLWKATAEKGMVYLFGSLHFGAPDMYPLPDAVAKAFAASDALVVEADPQDQESEAALKLAQVGRYDDGSRLEDHVKPATWQKLMALAKSLRMNEEDLSRQKPWMAAMSLSAHFYRQAGLTPELGIDRTLIKEAGTHKPILALESVDLQAKLFASLSAQEQEQILIQTLNELQRGQEFIKELLAAWKQGDAEAMDLIVRQNFGRDALAAKLYKVLFADRNAAMADKLKALVSDGRTYFVVVGAGHLGGEQGLLKRLEDKGFKVTQP